MLIKKGNKEKEKTNMKVRNDYNEAKIKCRIKLGCHQKFQCSILGFAPLPGSAPEYVVVEFLGLE